MTTLTNATRRMTRGTLSFSWGPDSGRCLVASLEPGDVLTLRPAGTRRAETISLFDVYSYALRCRVNRGFLEKAREKKAKKAQRLADMRLARSLKSRTPEELSQ
jgi:hypothetical protein